MSKKSEMKKQLEEILGHTFDAEALKVINLIQSVASTTKSDGTTTQKDLLIGIRPNRCYQTNVLDVSGVATTGNDGRSVFRLTDFLCHAGERFSQPINVVATPLSSAPHFPTVVHSLLDNGADVEIKISMWDAGGAPAANVSFDWRCRVELQTIIL